MIILGIEKTSDYNISYLTKSPEQNIVFMYIGTYFALHKLLRTSIICHNFQCSGEGFWDNLTLTYLSILYLVTNYGCHLIHHSITSLQSFTTEGNVIYNRSKLMLYLANGACVVYGCRVGSGCKVQHGGSGAGRCAVRHPRCKVCRGFKLHNGAFAPVSS